MEVRIEESWKTHLEGEFEKPYFKQLSRFVRDAYTTRTVYPAPKNIFRAFDLCPFTTVQVVILGQDPYHGPGQANGLSFAVDEEVRVPPSLQNIFKEIEAECGESMHTRHGNLERWATQGVLLLNATLTVEAGTPGSHQKRGWEEFTDAAVAALAREREHLVFLLWGNYARAKGAHIDRGRHLVLESPHPSPFSAHTGFLGNGHFKKANEYLVDHGNTPIDWL